MIFRFDDVCYNSDMELHVELTDFLQEKFPGGNKIMWAISPLVCDYELPTQRVFPKGWNALSDYKQFYKMNRAEVPTIPDNVLKASHGLIHVDHRLLTLEAQEMSILTSCCLTGAGTFVPPFNKWNKDTESICKDNKIKLIKFEDGWLSMEYNKFNSRQEMWYLHAREWTLESFKEWFE